MVYQMVKKKWKNKTNKQTKKQTKTKQNKTKQKQIKKQNKTTHKKVTCDVYTPFDNDLVPDSQQIKIMLSLKRNKE